MTEFEETVALANRILELPNADPDADEAMLARQFLRAVERIDKLHKIAAFVPGAAYIKAREAAGFGTEVGPV